MITKNYLNYSFNRNWKLPLSSFEVKNPGYVFLVKTGSLKKLIFFPKRKRMFLEIMTEILFFSLHLHFQIGREISGSLIYLVHHTLLMLECSTPKKLRKYYFFETKVPNMWPIFVYLPIIMNIEPNLWDTLYWEKTLHKGCEPIKSYFDIAFLIVFIIDI